MRPHRAPGQRTKTRSIEQVLHGNELGPLIQKASQLEALGRILAEVLPESLQPQCRLANVQNKVLVLQTFNNASASKLRMIAPRILERFTREVGALESVKIEIRPLEGPHSRPARPRTPGRLPPPSAAPALESLADSMADPRLQAAVRTLARKARQKAA
jgi:hypothetical protein